MTEVYAKALATIEEGSEEKFGPNGGFTAILSTPSLDRDGDRLHREEWKDFTQERYPLDMDHGMTVADTIGSFTPYWDGDRMMMDAYFAPDEKSQRVRMLVTPDPATGVRHINSVSVAFMTDKSKKAGEARRELLNAGVVAIPSNRDAVIQCSKSARAAVLVESGVMTPEEAKAALLLDEAEEKDAPKPYGDVTYADPEDGKYPIDTVAHIRAALAYINMPKNYAALGDHAAHVKRAIEAAARAHGIHVSDDKSFEIPESKAAGTNMGGGGDSGALVQAIHDASVHLGATCMPSVSEVQSTQPPAASSSGGKSTEEVDIKSQTLTLEGLPDELDLEQFKAALTEVLNPPKEESPAEAPAEAAAASDEEPAPADDAAVDAADNPEVDPNKQADEMLLGLFAAQNLTN